jgi:hypothetical protein
MQLLIRAGEQKVQVLVRPERTYFSAMIRRGLAQRTVPGNYGSRFLPVRGLWIGGEFDIAPDVNAFNAAGPISQGSERGRE